MAASFLFALTLSIATLALLDFYLSDSQKRRIVDATTLVWNWLDDVSKLSFLDFLRERPIQWSVTLAAGTIGFISVWSLASVFGIILFMSPTFWVIAACLLPVMYLT